MGRDDAPLPRLGDLEMAVLEHLWDTGEADVTETHGAVGQKRGSSVNTVGSALERLHKKGLVTRHKVSHAYRYEPVMGREELAARRVLEATGGSKLLTSSGLLAAFVDLVADADEEALRQLSALIDRKRKERA